MNADDRRAVLNEATFRRVNEGIAAGRGLVDAARPIGFTCECARLHCNAIVMLTIAEYEAVRGHPSRFIVFPGHEKSERETVVARTGGHVIVEKHGEDARRVAQETDPRGEPA